MSLLLAAGNVSSVHAAAKNPTTHAHGRVANIHTPSPMHVPLPEPLSPHPPLTMTGDPDHPRLCRRFLLRPQALQLMLGVLDHLIETRLPCLHHHFREQASFTLQQLFFFFFLPRRKYDKSPPRDGVRYPQRPRECVRCNASKKAMCLVCRVSSHPCVLAEPLGLSRGGGRDRIQG